MLYLEPDDFAAHGVPADVPAHLLGFASALIDAHCRRATLAVAEHTERLRLGPTGRVRLTYLPVVELVRASARYAAVRDALSNDLATAASWAFSLPGTWTALDTASLDVDAATGELTVPRHPLGFAFNEVEIAYRAGLDPLPAAVKAACAAVVRNALATPALNVRATSLDRLHMEYFADTLFDRDVRALLAPFVARKVA